MSDITWVLESGVFPETHAPIRKAVRDRGHRLVDWSDTWWADGVPSRVPVASVVFHGSLGNAARIDSELRWRPGSFCPAEAFRCSSWYESARPWLVHAEWTICAADELVADARGIAERLRSPGRLFVRPDSPLKPFSGRVVDTATRTPVPVPPGSAAAAFASEVAKQLPEPAVVYVLDVCECDGELRLLELNPFGGADLYACDANAVVESVSAVAAESGVG